MVFLVKQKGMSLIEILLVILISSTFLVMGIKIYQQTQFELQLSRVKNNVDVLFESMRGYYLANCRANRDYAAGTVITSATGQLDPTVNTPPVSSMVPITISSGLATPGYLTKWPLPFSLLVTSGYVAQFNLYNNSTTYSNTAKQVYFCSNATNCLAPTALPTKAVNNVYLWTIQIAVQVTDSTQAAYLKGRLNADCRSSKVGSIVTPCSKSPAAGDYLVFERLPSRVSSSTANSPLWLSIPGLKQFTEQYTNDNDYAVTYDSTTSGFPGYQNYLCGG